MPRAALFRCPGLSGQAPHPALKFFFSFSPWFLVFFPQELALAHLICRRACLLHYPARGPRALDVGACVGAWVRAWWLQPSLILPPKGLLT